MESCQRTLTCKNEHTMQAQAANAGDCCCAALWRYRNRKISHLLMCAAVTARPLGRRGLEAGRRAVVAVAVVERIAGEAFPLEGARVAVHGRHSGDSAAARRA